MFPPHLLKNSNLDQAWIKATTYFFNARHSLHNTRYCFIEASKFNFMMQFVACLTQRINACKKGSTRGRVGRYVLLRFLYQNLWLYSRQLTRNLSLVCDKLLGTYRGGLLMWSFLAIEMMLYANLWVNFLISIINNK